MIILGIDPGSASTGYGVITSTNGRLKYIAHGVIRVGSKCPLPQRLLSIYQGIKEVMGSHHPQCVIVEAIFHARNPRSSLVLGQARGVVLLAAVHEHVEVFEYSPLQVKQAITGYGRAEKVQMRALVKTLLAMKIHPPMDASDALALAICHAHTHRPGQRWMRE